MAVTRLNSGRMIHMPATSIVDINSRLVQTQLENHTSANTQHKTLLQIHSNIQEQPPAYQSITMSSSNTTPDPSPSPSVEATNPHTGLIHSAANKQGAMSLCACRMQPQCTNFVLIRGYRCHWCVEHCPPEESEAPVTMGGRS